MTLISAQDTTFVRAETPLASSVEIHSMTMDNGVMKMRMLPEMPLTAGKAEKLAPGGFHLMLFDLKKPLAVNEQVEFTLSFRDKAGKVTQQVVAFPIKDGE
jgi:periplasmic copper chaperone A